MSVDGTPISQADLARMEADEALHAEWQRKAARVIAASAIDAEDCRQLLAMLGLGTQIIAEARNARAAEARTARAAAARATRTARAADGKPARKSGRRTAAA